MAEDRQALAMQYMQLLQSGVPASEAFKQVYPKGIPTAAQQQREEAKAKQGSALAGTGGTIAGLLGVRYGMKGLESMSGSGTTAAETTASTANTGASAVPATPTGLSGNIASSSGATPVGTAADGGTMMSDGSVVPAGGDWMTAQPGTLGSIAAAAAVAKGSYDTQKGYEAGGKGMRSGLTQIGAGGGMLLGGPLGAAAGAAGGNALGYGIQGNGIKNDLMLAALGPIGWAALGAKKLGAFDHRTTRQQTQINTKNLLKASENKDYQNYVNGMREQYNVAPTGPAFNGGQFENFEQYKKAGLNAQDLSGVYGNLKLGEKYTALSQEMKNAYTQSQIDKGNYKSKKGEVQFVDQNTAQADFDNLIGGMKPQQQAVTRPISGKIPAVSDALAKKQIAQTGQFGNQLLQAISGFKK